jgi:MHS family metabolite:H+ symporter-like MFS transporter
MMGICTTLIGVLPTYAQVGILAPLLLVTLRIVQGFGAGAEIAGAGTMLAEYAPKGKRGIISSLVAMGTNCGTLSATAIWAFMFFWLDRSELLEWGWRIPFLASAVVMIFAIWLRLNLKESPVFEKVNDGDVAPAASKDDQTSLGAMLKSKSFWLAAGLRFGQAGNSGLIQTFLAGYMVQTLLFDKYIPTDALMISSIIGFITIPLLGWISDKVGRRIPYMIMSLSGLMLAWPMISIIVDKSYEPSVIMLSMIIIHNFAVLGLFALENITMAELFGARNRFTRLAIAKETGGLVAVGLGPIVAGILCNMTGSWHPIAYMLMAYSTVSFLAAYIMPEVKDRDLTIMDDAAK